MDTERGGAARTPLIERVRRRKHQHKQRSRIYRISFATGGVLVVLLGLALIPLPGPGWLVVALGIAMLALEFDRAERILERVLERIERVGEQASRAGPVARVVGGGVLVLGAVAVVAALLIWDIPYFPG